MDKEKIKKELQALIEESHDIYYACAIGYTNDFFENYNEKIQKEANDAFKKIKYPKTNYYSWYHNTRRIVHILAPEHLDEFEKFYTGSKHVKKTTDLDSMSAGITHYLQGWSLDKGTYKIDFFDTFQGGFNAQRNILIAIGRNIDHALFNLESEIQHRVYKSEMEIARDLKKQKYLRAAGAIAGVILEVHLKNVVINKGIMPKKKNPGISDYNEALKDVKAYEVATWRQVQMCGDIRNKCVHPKETEPTDYEIDTIISSAEIIIATIN